LIRIWGWSPRIGPELARFSRRYFFSGAVLAFALVSAYAWAQFPYDNVCDPRTNVQYGKAGVYYNVAVGPPGHKGAYLIPSVNVTQDTAVVFCSQERRHADKSFPPTSNIQPKRSKWMGNQQETLTDIYGWTAVVAVVGFIRVFFGKTIVTFIGSFWIGTAQHQLRGQDQKIDYSANEEISAYVPQVRLKSFPFPFLVCDIDHIHQNLIGWNDPSHSYDYWNLIFDVPYEGMSRKKVIEGNTRDTAEIAMQEDYSRNADADMTSSGHATGAGRHCGHRPIYSLVKHYPPKWLVELVHQEWESRTQEARNKLS
jgi:hypothetical protein